MLWFAALFLVPESPRWLVMRPRRNEAVRELSRLKAGGAMKCELAEIAGSRAGAGERLWGRSREVILPAMRSPMILGLIVAIAQQATGINAICFNAPRGF